VGLNALYCTAGSPLLIGVRSQTTHSDFIDLVAVCACQPTSEREEADLVLCARQLVRDTVVLISDHTSLKIMYSKQLDEPYFEVRRQRSFLEWCNTLNIGRTKLRTVVEQERANILYGQLAFMPSGFGTVEEVSKSEFNLFLGFKSWKNLYGKTYYKDFSRVEKFLQHIKKIVVLQRRGQGKTGGRPSMVLVLLGPHLLPPRSKNRQNASPN